MSFAAPVWLWSALAVPLLWWWLARSGRPLPLPWPALRLWPPEQDAARRQARRFLPPAFAWPMLLALAAMSLAAARPVLDGGERDELTVVFDVTASMGIRSEGESARFELAHAKLVGELANQVPERAVRVLAYPDYRSLWSGTAGAFPATAEIFAPEDRGADDALAAATPPANELWWVADRFPHGLMERARRIAAGRTLGANAGFVSAEPSRREPGLVWAVVACHGQRAMELEVLGPGARVLAAFTLDPGAHRALRLRAAAGGCSGFQLRAARGDELAADDVLWAAAGRGRARVALRGIGPELERAVRADASIDVVEALAEASIAILAGMSREVELPGHCCAIRLGAGSGAPQRGLLRAAEVVDADLWSRLGPLAIDAREVSGERSLFRLERADGRASCVAAIGADGISTGLASSDLEALGRGSDPVHLPVLIAMLLLEARLRAVPAALARSGPDAPRVPPWSPDRGPAGAPNLLDPLESAGELGVASDLGAVIDPAAGQAHPLARPLVFIALLGWIAGLLLRLRARRRPLERSPA